MTKPQSLPVEEARKKFADVLDGTQFRSTHTEITRRGKPAGYVVPPEWYAEAVEALAEKRHGTTSSPPASAAAPRAQVTETIPEHATPPEWLGLRPEIAALSRERARELFAKAETRDAGWGLAQRRELDAVPSGWRFHAGTQAAVDAGLVELPGAEKEH
jgi:prevent-host-death family protein